MTSERPVLQSLGIALDLVDLVAQHPQISVTELARRAGVAKSTASRTCSVLVEHGILERGDGRRLILGSRLIDLGNLARLRRGLSSELLLVLTEARDRVQETVQLAVPHGTKVTYVERVEADRNLRYTGEKYRFSALHSSGSGKVIAAWHPELAERCIREGLAPETGYTIVVPDLFRAELERIRRQGYAGQIEEKELGAASLAVPVRAEPDGPVIAALGMAGPVRRVMDRRAAHVAALQAAAARLGELIRSGEVNLPSATP